MNPSLLLGKVISKKQLLINQKQNKMKSLAISVIEREKVGKSNTRSLRNQGNVPCVLYGEKSKCVFMLMKMTLETL